MRLRKGQVTVTSLSSRSDRKLGHMSVNWCKHLFSFFCIGNERHHLTLTQRELEWFVYHRKFRQVIGQRANDRKWFRQRDRVRRSWARELLLAVEKVCPDGNFLSWS